jgi:hypothetical protein
MFESQPTTAEPLLQLRYAPAIELPTTLAVRLSLTAEEEFTDNADQTKDDRRSEFRTRVVPGVSIRADRPVGSFSLSYAPEVVFHDNSIDDTEVNQNLSARASLFPAGPFQLRFANDFTESNDFRDINDPGSRRTGRNDFVRNIFSTEAAYVLPRLRTGLEYTNVLLNETVLNATVAATDDTRFTHIIRPNAVYTDPRYTIGGSFGATRGNENSSVFIPYWRYDVDGRFQYVVTPTVNAGLTAYYERQNPDTGRDFSIGRARVTTAIGFGPDGTLTAGVGPDVFWQPDDSTSVRASVLAAYTHRFATFSVTARYEQGYRNRSEELDPSITFTRLAGIFLRTAYFRNTIGTFGFRYEENEFQVTSLAAGAPAGTTDRTWSIDLDIRYLLVRSLFLRLGYIGTIRTSTQESAEFYENRVSLGLTYEYFLF